MKIRTGYFYQLRFFKDNMIPISTCVWDPKWFHNFKGQEHCFTDGNNVVNGLRYESLVPGLLCEGLCRGTDGCNNTPDTCMFLKNYRRQLDNLDFNVVYSELSKIAEVLSLSQQVEEEPVIVLMVYEKPDNPCSERWVIHDWFREHGVEIKEIELTEA